MTGKKNNYIKRESLIGLPVIDARKQMQIGIVKDLYINEKWTHVAGIYLTCKGWGRNDIDIPYASLTIGTDSIMAEGDQINKAGPKDNNIVKSLLNKQVIREDGQELGFVSDIILDTLTGRIEGLELSEGLVDDLLKGRQLMPYFPFEQREGDIIVLSREEAEQCSPFNKGIKNIFLNKI